MQVKINTMSLAFCHLIIFYEGHLSSGAHEFHLLLELQHLGSFRKDPAVDLSAFPEASRREDIVG